MCRTPARSAAPTISSASATDMASGFSHSTWRPLSAAATTRSRWKRLGVATITASTGASFSSANGSAYVRVTPVAAEASASAAGLGSQSATTSASRQNPMPGM